ncbi:MAG TPA: rhodanese-like domain-containing protein [Methylophilaceae bacterium]|nr:rhodanese-like domain-containing protein [Methylophilaceae bacterium]
MSGYQDIDATYLQSLLGLHNVLLVDVRNNEEVARGVIPGAVHIPLSLIPVKADELGGEQPLVFYCHAGIRSAQACAFMASKGRDNIFNLQGGVIAWGKAGHPFEPKQ